MAFQAERMRQTQDSALRKTRAAKRPGQGVLTERENRPAGLGPVGRGSVHERYIAFFSAHVIDICEPYFWIYGSNPV